MIDDNIAWIARVVGWCFVGCIALAVVGCADLFGIT